MSEERLPIESLRSAFLATIEAKPVVVSSPTGSGKSTQVPRWCADRGRVLVIEPRRVACRSLAARVAELETCSLGSRVGYSVRDDHKAGEETRILFATPGIVLRMLEGGNLGSFPTVVLDEFHERSLDVDLILALLLERHADRRLVVMSATMDGGKVAAHIRGQHLQAEGRLFPVERSYVPNEGKIPSVAGLEQRLLRAIEAASDHPGDILVFLPGKAEIARARSTLGGLRHLELLTLHGGLSLREQSRVFETTSSRRVVLATNVAETSLTIPGIGVVIDSGLVRRTEYHGGRGFLTLMPISLDSADQRAGRAGRLAPGVCFRLWSREAILAPQTPPEIFRESLTPLVLAASACGCSKAEALPFLDPPKTHALDAARQELQHLKALDNDGYITERGKKLFGLPLSPFLGALLVAAEARGCLHAAVDLVAVLAVNRPLYTGGAPDPSREGDIREGGCDAMAYIKAVREGRARKDPLDPFTLEEARAYGKRLRAALSLPASKDAVDRKSLAMAILDADSASAFVARRRKRQVAWSNGGTEIELGRESAANLAKTEVILVLETRALGLGYRDRRIIVTCAMPIPPRWMVEAGLGRLRVAETRVEKGIAVSVLERIYARRVLETIEEVPKGELAREAIALLLLNGRLFAKAIKEAQERLEAWTLFLRLEARGGLRRSSLAAEWEEDVSSPWTGAVPELEGWLLERVEALGVESGEDLPLLSAEDFLPPALPETAQRRLDRDYPRTIDLGDAFYRVRYDLKKRELVLEQVRGLRREPPALNLLPAYPGWSIRLEKKGRSVVLRGGR